MVVIKIKVKATNKIVGCISINPASDPTGWKKALNFKERQAFLLQLK